mmetsp:Transcript_36982/g.87859  ORF Transcript_36982/g.87859 Transcript_36982/m.87859 type:complete len:213 (-) Transcript_36982:324-962(-)
MPEDELVQGHRHVLRSHALRGDVDLRLMRHIHLHRAAVKSALLQEGAEGAAGAVVRAVRPDDEVEELLLHRGAHFCCHLALHLGLRVQDRVLDEVAHDLVDVSAVEADLRELGRLNLDKGRVCNLRKAASNLCLAAACRPNHEDVLGDNICLEVLGDALPPPPVAHGDRNCALGIPLTHNVLVEQPHNFSWSEVISLAGVMLLLGTARQSIS